MGPLTLAVDIDVLLSSGSIADVTSSIAGPQPSFSYSVGERPSSAAALPTTKSSGSLSPVTPQPTSNGNSFQTRHVWMRPGVRRFLLAIQPHFHPVLLVRRRCSNRRCSCIGRSVRSASTSGGVSDNSPGGVGVDGTAALTDHRERDVGGCGAALLAAALPYIDPDGQFFGQRVVLIQEQPRPRTAQPRMARVSCPEGAQLTAAKSAVVAAAAAATAAAAARATPALSDASAPPLPLSPSMAAAAMMAVSDMAFPVPQVSDLAALPAMLGEPPSAILIVTVAERSLFGSGLAEQVVQCQPYRKEYGKYDDLLDCLASVVSELLVEPSVSQGLLRLGLLHAKLQPSPMMQALHAQAALRQAAAAQQQQQQQHQQHQQHQQRQRVQVKASAGSLGAQVQGIPSEDGPERLQSKGLQQPTQQAQQPQKQKHAAAAARVRKSSSAVSAKPKRPSQKADSSRRDSDDCGGGGGEERGSGGGGGRSGAGIPASPSASPLPPIPELPLLEVGSEWHDPVVAEEEDYNEATATAAPASTVLAPEPLPCDRSSGGTSCSSNCISGAHDQAPGPSHQSRSISSPPTLCCTTPDSASIGNRPSRSSAGSNSSGSSNSNSASPATVAAPLPPHGGRRMAWDDVSSRPTEGPDVGQSAANGKQILSKTSQSYCAGGGDSSGGVFSRARAGGGSGGELGWRPSSFPAATKPRVTRHVSDCVSLLEPNNMAAGFGAVEAPLSSPLGAAANAVAAATSRLFARILGGRRQRRCRPSEVGSDGDNSTSAGAMAAAVSVTGAGRSAIKATPASSSTLGVAADGSVHSKAAVQQVRSVSASAAEASLLTTSLGGRATAAAAASRPAPHAISSEILLEPGTATNPVSPSGAMPSPSPSARTTPATSRPTPMTSPATADATISSLSQSQPQLQMQMQALAVPGNSYTTRRPLLRTSLPGSALDDLVDFPVDLHEQHLQQERWTAPLHGLPSDTMSAIDPGYKPETVEVRLAAPGPLGHKPVEVLGDGKQLELATDDPRRTEQEEAHDGLVSILDATGRGVPTTTGGWH
ncbi:hypothetical protein Vretimale_14217 [Volvox reticuliferus]|uniref:Uncharacterized protein n=1 Tax=Volvox reticuliferus TaxID=1737510 RepID=A0A8J4GNA0_9CHLO|nr:hypothetical protein Vretifemale_15191 [Volvox reticuliferus]GIM10565.1 hypothetical protein Vretimale_14217 [Volvox reticuliferus]